MSDQFPSKIEIEIDRPRLRRYLRVKWFLAWACFSVFWGVFLGVGVGTKTSRADRPTLTKTVLAAVKGTGIGFASGIGVAAVLYFTFSHWLAGRVATGIELSVEDGFLRLRQGVFVTSDRKLHFRSIVDYTVVQSWLMRRFEIHALLMTTPSGGQYQSATVFVPSSTITVFGIKDCLKVRDMLAEIDRLREHR